MPRRNYDPAREERAREKELNRLINTSRDIIEYDEDCRPFMYTKGLAWLCKNETKYPDKLEEVLKKLLDTGMLSQSIEGNFLVTAKGVVILTLNPFLDGEPCYFTNEHNAKTFAKNITVRFGNKSIETQGEYPLSRPITPQEWREIRAKHGSKQFDSIVQRLQNLEILTCQRKDKFSIVKKTVSKAGEAEYEYLNFRSGKGDGLLYFQESNDAYHFLEAFPNIPAKSEISVVQEQVELT